MSTDKTNFCDIFLLANFHYFDDCCPPARLLRCYATHKDTHILTYSICSFSRNNLLKNLTLSTHYLISTPQVGQDFGILVHLWSGNYAIM